MNNPSISYNNNQLTSTTTHKMNIHIRIVRCSISGLTSPLITTSSYSFLLTKEKQQLIKSILIFKGHRKDQNYLRNTIANISCRQHLKVQVSFLIIIRYYKDVLSLQRIILYTSCYNMSSINCFHKFSYTTSQNLSQ